MRYLNLPAVPNLGVEPTGTPVGSLMRNSVSGRLRMYDGAAWQDAVPSTPDMIRVKASLATSAASGVYTVMTTWTADYIQGAAGAFTIAAGVVTIVKAGIYAMSLNITCSGGVMIEAALGNPTAAFCRSTGPTNDALASASTHRYFAAGTTVRASIFNFGPATASVVAETAANPCGFEIVRFAGS